jgi:hypothetical protein
MPERSSAEECGRILFRQPAIMLEWVHPLQRFVQRVIWL